MLLATLISAYRAYQRTRSRWPHAVRIWSIFSVLDVGLFGGGILASSTVALSDLGEPPVLTIGSPLANVLLGIGVGWACVSCIAMILWYSMVYNKASTQYPIANV